MAAAWLTVDRLQETEQSALQHMNCGDLPGGSLLYIDTHIYRYTNMCCLSAIGRFVVAQIVYSFMDFANDCSALPCRGN